MSFGQLAREQFVIQRGGAFWPVCIIGLLAFAWIAGIAGIAEIAGKPEESSR
jgi:hypothetical protein